MTTPKLSVSLRPADGGAVVRLAGTIDADFDPKELVAVRGVLVIDLDEVRRISSFGVREWIRALNAVTADSIIFHNARPPIVSQFNMVLGFGGRGILASAYLPFICPDCETECELHVDLTRHHTELVAGDVPPMVCPKCGAACELDESPAMYLSYIRSKPAPVLSEVERRVFAGENTAASADPLRVQKEVDGRVTGLFLQGTLDGKARFKRAAEGLEGLVVIVCEGIRGADAAGAERFLQLLELPEAEIYLARVRTSLLGAIPVPRRSLVVGRVASVLVPLTCPSCGPEARVEVKAKDPLDEKGARPFSCRRCSHEGRLHFQPEQEAALKVFLSALVPPEVDAFLRAHPGEVISGDGRSESGGMPIAPRPTSAAAAPLPLQSKYKLLRRIGQGGMAEVFLAEQTGLEGFHKKVVLKRILPSLAANEDFVKMFLQEARTAARVGHPNVVTIFDLGKEGDTYFMAMEYVKGWDLRSVMNAARRVEQPIPIAVACRIAADMLAGLHAAHVCADDDGALLGIVHRDVSPHNVLVSTEGAVKITDFGIAKTGASAPLTRPGMVKGKIIYMAPEQIDDSLGPVDPRSDVFAVGIVLYEMLTSSSPFRRDSEIAAMRAVLEGPIPMIRLQRSDVSSALVRIVDKGLERDRTKRFQTAQQMQRALEQVLIDEQLASTTSHLSAWLQSIADEASKSGSLAAPGFTPTGLTPDDVLDLDLETRPVPLTGSATVRVDRLDRPAKKRGAGEDG